MKSPISRRSRLAVALLVSAMAVAGCANHRLTAVPRTPTVCAGEPARGLPLAYSVRTLSAHSTNPTNAGTTMAAKRTIRCFISITLLTP